MPPMTPARISSKRQVGALLDQERTQEVVHGADENRPHQKKSAPAAAVAPVQPENGRRQNQRRSELRDAEHEHQCGQDGANGTPAMARPMPPRIDCTNRGNADAEGHGTNRLTGQHDGALAAFAAETIAETPHAVSEAARRRRRGSQTARR
jgi:hypothetical protein